MSKARRGPRHLRGRGTSSHYAVLTTTEALAAGEPQPLEVGGAPGHVIDVRLGEDPPPCLGTRETSCYPIHEAFENAVIWVVAAGRPVRIWIVDVEGQTVMIATDARRDRFDDWVARFEEVIFLWEWRVEALQPPVCDRLRDGQHGRISRAAPPRRSPLAGPGHSAP